MILSLFHILMDKEILIVAQVITRSCPVDRNLVQKLGEETHEDTADITNILSCTKAPEGRTGDKPRHFKVLVIYQERG